MKPNEDEEEGKFIMLPNNDNDHHTDGLTLVVGEAGPFQWTAAVLTGLCITTHSLAMLSNKWLTMPTDYWCQRPPAYQHMDPEAWVNISAPLLDSGEYDKCSVFATVFNEVSDDNRPPEDTPTIPCTNFEYDTSEFQNTAVQRWDLVCSRSYLPNYIQTIFFLGNLIGVFVSGPVGDAIGRKHCYCLFLTIWVAVGALGAFTTDLYLWMLTRFIVGFTSLGYNNCLVVYLVEITTGKWRSALFYYFMTTGWDLGIILLGTLAYFIRNIPDLELVIALSNLPYLFAWILMLESPRWLLSKGRFDEAKHVMKKMCKWNKKDPSAVDAFVDNFDLNEKATQSLRLRDLIKLPATRRNTILMSLTWLSFSLGYFGLQYNTPAFDWNKFIVFMFPAFLTIPMNYVLPTLENTLGRKAVLTGSLLFGGAMLFLTLVLPKGLPIVIVAWMGTVSCAAAFRSGYTFAKELYPTTLRASGLGTASAAARIGSMISPLVAILGTFDQVLPMLVFGASMLVTGFGSVWIWPETKSLRLMYTAEECEAEAATTNEWVEALKCRRRKHKSNKEEGQIKK